MLTGGTLQVEFNYQEIFNIFSSVFFEDFFLYFKYLQILEAWVYCVKQKKQHTISGGLSNCNASWRVLWMEIPSDISMGKMSLQCKFFLKKLLVQKYHSKSWDFGACFYSFVFWRSRQQYKVKQKKIKRKWKWFGQKKFVFE